MAERDSERNPVWLRPTYYRASVCTFAAALTLYLGATMRAHGIGIFLAIWFVVTLIAFLGSLWSLYNRKPVTSAMPRLRFVLFVTMTVVLLVLLASSAFGIGTIPW